MLHGVVPYLAPDASIAGSGDRDSARITLMIGLWGKGVSINPLPMPHSRSTPRGPLGPNMRISRAGVEHISKSEGSRGRRNERLGQAYQFGHGLDVGKPVPPQTALSSAHKSSTGTPAVMYRVSPVWVPVMKNLNQAEVAGVGAANTSDSDKTFSGSYDRSATAGGEEKEVEVEVVNIAELLAKVAQKDQRQSTDVLDAGGKRKMRRQHTQEAEMHLITPELSDQDIVGAVEGRGRGRKVLPVYGEESKVKFHGRWFLQDLQDIYREIMGQGRGLTGN